MKDATIVYVIQCNRNIDKCGIYETSWYDVAIYNTKDDARLKVQNIKYLTYIGRNGEYHLPIEQKHFRIVKRETIDTVIV